MLEILFWTKALGLGLGVLVCATVAAAGVWLLVREALTFCTNVRRRRR